MKLANNFGWIVAAMLVAALGCSSEAPTTVEAPPQVDGSQYLLSSEPEGARSVIEVRETAATDDEVVVTGRIGGSAEPWVDGRAAFSIVDPSLQACSDIEGDACPTPWDYCCVTDKIPTSNALVKIVDDQGNLVEQDARELLNLKELQTVVVRGKAHRDDAGNLTVLASDVYVRE
jgi:hypothetical protein